MKLAILGLGYIGLADAVLLSGRHQVSVYDPDTVKTDALAAGRSPFQDPDLAAALAHGRSFRLCHSVQEACQQAAWVFIAVPTDLREDGAGLDTRIVEEVVAQIRLAAPQAAVVLRSTLPIGMTDRLSHLYPDQPFLYYPAFSREGSSLREGRSPSRILIGSSRKDQAAAELLANLIQSVVVRREAPVLLTRAAEAEAAKLFSNAYLALRLAFFNELDSFARESELDCSAIVRAMAPDPRIGGTYNKPSFGFGGNCLPKDLSQLVKHTPPEGFPLLRAIAPSNKARAWHCFRDMEARLPEGGTLGFYRLTAKEGSDNFRSSAVLTILELARGAQLPLLIYEPLCSGASFHGVPVTGDLAFFKETCALIAADRITPELADAEEKLCTRDPAFFGGGC